MANDFQLNQAASIAGLGTFSCTLLSTGPVTLECRSTIPGSVDVQTQQQSNLQIQLKQNSTSLVTVGGSAQNPTPSQGSIGTSVSFEATANDVVHVVLSSSNAIDNLPNSVKSIINLSQGI